jgi:hypothetical protein
MATGTAPIAITPMATTAIEPAHSQPDGAEADAPALSTGATTR